jgi:hypothetical protein
MTNWIVVRFIIIILKSFILFYLKVNFFHVSTIEDNSKYIAFVVLNRHYEFFKILFGLYNSCATFRRFINAIFKKFNEMNLLF